MRHVPVGFLEGRFVVAERRRQGIGRALVRAAEARARARWVAASLHPMRWPTTPSAPAHQALGFDEVAVVRCFRKPLEPNADR